MNDEQTPGLSSVAMLGTCIVLYPFLAAAVLSIVFRQDRMQSIAEFLLLSFGAFITTVTVHSLRAPARNEAAAERWPGDQ